jgi:pimeloyl-ACP methyl ester carboxylesterase
MLAATPNGVQPWGRRCARGRRALADVVAVDDEHIGAHARELVADVDAFVVAADARPPYLLVGQSMGGNIVFMYAQAHPEKVAGLEDVVIESHRRRHVRSLLRRACSATRWC